MNKCTWSLKPFVCSRIVLVGFCQTFTCCFLSAVAFIQNNFQEIHTRRSVRDETKQISHFTVVYLVAKPLIWSEAESDLVGSPRLTML